MRRALFLLLIGTAPALAQAPGSAGIGTTARTGAIFESYSLDSGLAFKRISEISLPVSVFQRFGDRLAVDVSTAFARASVQTTTSGTLTLSGLVDTDIRAAYTAIPGRLTLTLVGTLPTGNATVADSVLPLFGALATDLLDFTTPSFGGGGGLTGGAATAFKLGQNWALGAAASYHYTANYVPVTGGGTLSPGDDIRVRLGTEGPLGGGTYFRGAFVFTASGRDTVAGESAAFAGDRVLLYSMVSMPVGRSSLSVYGFDMLRLRARGVPTTASGAVAIPKGNVLSLGARLDRPLSPVLTLSPHVDFRHELNGADTTAGLTLLGYLVRPGADLRWRVSSQAALIFQGQLAFGSLHNGTQNISLLGPRLSALVEWQR